MGEGYVARRSHRNCLAIVFAHVSLFAFGIITQNSARGLSPSTRGAAAAVVAKPVHLAWLHNVHHKRSIHDGGSGKLLRHGNEMEIHKVRFVFRSPHRC